MVGGLSNCGEGGEHISRYGTIRGSRIKQFASGRFGIWAGYLADPMLRELEIKIGQGAKPGEGGQLPAHKVTVQIAAARGGTPGVELISPPPHHDTYSIEDLAQLIHDCKAARVRVIVKLVSSEGIGIIAAGVAKAGADVINVAGNTGGTGAAAVTSLKYAGRSAEIGVAEVHQALVANGIRQKVVLRASGAHQTASDVVKSALLGADSYEFGTTALMMLKCVMAKNCNIKCPAGLTTNAEAFEGDPRALAQYLLNISHEVRELLATLGLPSLRDARGRSDLLHLLDHPSSIGRLDLRAMLALAAGFRPREPDLPGEGLRRRRRVPGAAEPGWRRHGSGGLGQHEQERRRSAGHRHRADAELRTDADGSAVATDHRGRRYLLPDSVVITTTGSAGQSYGAFCNDGMTLTHTGTCNDGVGKSQCGGSIAVRSPGGGSDAARRQRADRQLRALRRIGWTTVRRGRGRRPVRGAQLRRHRGGRGRRRLPVRVHDERRGVQHRRVRQGRRQRHERRLRLPVRPDRRPAVEGQRRLGDAGAGDGGAVPRGGRTDAARVARRGDWLGESH